VLKTHSKQYLANWTAYLDECLDVEQTEGKPLTAKLAFAVSDFRRVANHPYGLRKFPNTQDRLADYLAGLPFGFAFSYNDILKAASKLHGSAIPANKADTVCEQWFDHCAMMLITIAKKHGLSFHGVTP
jgi:O6-methylguanine-DNA--protein-cysteine methyltransferase